MDIYAKSGVTIHIGRVGENLATNVIFDISKWVAQHPGGAATLVIDKDGLVYPRAIEPDPTNANQVRWIITSSDTAVAGMGKCELIYSVPTSSNEESKGVIVKSAIYDFIVTNSLEAEEGAEPPDPFESWFDQVLEAASVVEISKNVATDAADAAAESAANAEGFASSAEASELKAAQSADAADKSADAASESAGAAGSSAIEAAGSAKAAGDSETNAKASETNAKASETNASSAASTATRQAERAEAAEGMASGYAEGTRRDKLDAEAAKAAAETAESGAKTAKNDAETAKTGAEAAQMAAEAAAGIANGAAASAGDSERIATNAANTVLGNIHIAEESAMAAETSSQKAEMAMQGAEEAWMDAEEAKGQAVLAMNYAKEAQANAESAKEIAENVSQNPPRIGEKDLGENPDYWYVWNRNTSRYEKSGYKVRFSIVQTYETEEQMRADTSREVGDFVIVSTQKEEKDNPAMLWVLGTEGWTKVTDLTGYEGVGISHIDAPIYVGGDGKTDVYTIHLTNGESYTFEVYNGLDGNSITSIQKPEGAGAQGAVDKYIINLTKSDPVELEVYNGLDGVSPLIETAPTATGHTISITDRNGTKQIELFDGTGAGDMVGARYDKDLEVLNAGGISEYVKKEITRVTLKTWTASDIETNTNN